MRYTIRSGDSLSKIAKAHGLALPALLAANPRYRSRPDRIRVGDVVEIPDAPAAAPATGADQPATPPPARAEHASLGKLSVLYETGGRGPGVVSRGDGDAGGASYGSYQMTSKGGGTVGRFVAQPGFRWRDDFRGLQPGSPAFTTTWEAIAAAEPDAFHAAQHAYIKATHFDVLVARIRGTDGLDVTTRSAALQDVVWSTAVQHGGNTDVVHRALVALQREGAADPAAGDFDRRLIHAIYAERGRRDAGGKLVYFGKNSAKVQDGVAKRFVAEEADALRMLSQA